VGLHDSSLFHHLFLGGQTDSTTVKALLATDLSYLKTLHVTRKSYIFSYHFEK